MHYCWPRSWMPFIGPLIVFQTLVLTCRLHPECKGRSLCHRRPYLQSPFWGCTSCRWIALFLKERTDRTDPGDIANTCVYLYIATFHVYTLTPRSLCIRRLLLLFLRDNEIYSFFLYFFFFILLFFFLLLRDSCDEIDFILQGRV